MAKLEIRERPIGGAVIYRNGEAVVIIPKNTGTQLEALNLAVVLLDCVEEYFNG